LERPGFAWTLNVGSGLPLGGAQWDNGGDTERVKKRIPVQVRPPPEKDEGRSHFHGSAKGAPARKRRTSVLPEAKPWSVRALPGRSMWDQGSHWAGPKGTMAAMRRELKRGYQSKWDHLLKKMKDAAISTEAPKAHRRESGEQAFCRRQNLGASGLCLDAQCGIRVPIGRVPKGQWRRYGES